MDDIGIKDPKTIYNNEEVILRIRRYILEHIIWMNRVLANLEKAGCTILEAKSQFCMPRFRVIKFIYDTLKRHPDISKVIKIVEWPPPNNVTEVRAFVKVAVYYKVFIKNFAVIAALIYFLIKKRIRFAWDTKQ
jgi:hypothetical protein